MEAVHILGREQAFESLNGLLMRARSSRGAVVFVSGEAGAGKSTLTRHLAEGAGEDLGMGVFWGHCTEAGDAPSYWPWIQVLRAIGQKSPGILESPALRAAVAATLALIPEWLDLFPSIEAAPRLDPTHSRIRLMDGMANLILAHAREETSLLVLEDVHAMDSASAVFLDFLATRVSTTPIVLLATVRDLELQRDHPETPLARLFQRSERVTLSSWTEDQVRTFIGPELSPIAVSTIIKVSEGNPLFVVEAARLLKQRPELAEEVASLPMIDGARSILGERLSSCGAELHRHLQLASVIGREFHVSQLARLDPDVPVPELRTAVREGVLSVCGPGNYRFRHILFRDVLHDELDEVWRSRLHQRMAEILEAEPEADPERLAFHYGQAGEAYWQDNLRSSERAFERCMTRYAYVDAARYAAQAAAAARHPEATVEQRCSALIRLGRARMHAGALEAGRESCMEAVRLAREGQRSELFARAVLTLGGTFTIAEVDPRLVALLEEASRELDEEEVSLRARLLSRLAAALQPASDPMGPIQMARDAIALARTTEEDEVLLATMSSALSAMMDLASPSERRLLNEEYIRLAEQLRRPVEVHRGHMRRAMDVLEQGDFKAFEASAQAAERVASGLDHAAYHWQVFGLRALQAGLEGHFDAAAHHRHQASSQALEAHAPNARVTLSIQRVFSLRTRGQDEACLPLLDEVLEASNHAPFTTLLIDMLRCSTLWRMGQTTPPLPARGLESALSLRDSAFFILAAECSVASDSARAQELLEARPEAEKAFSSMGLMGLASDGPVSRAVALLQDACDDWTGAQRSFREAMHLCERANAWPLWVRSAYDFGLACRRRGLKEGEDLLARAAQRADTLKMSFWSFGGSGWPSSLDAPASAAEVVQMEKVGSAWSVCWRGRQLWVEERKGVRLLARLVARAGEELHVLDLDAEGQVTGRDLGDAGVHLDEEAIASYRRRSAELEKELAEAETWCDLGRAEGIQVELDMLRTELSRAVGLSGRSRRAGAPAERARVNVQRRLRDAVVKIAALDSELGRHLERSLKTGVFCIYEP